MKKIDTGDIILQKVYPIDDNDDYRTLLERAFKYCPDLVLEALNLIKDDRVQLIDQKSIHTTGLYCKKRTHGDEKLNWEQNSRNIFNFVRAITTPGPNARCNYEDSEMIIEKVSYYEDAPQSIETPGQILKVESDGFLVKTLDSFIKVIKYNCDKEIKAGGVLK